MAGQATAASGPHTYGALLDAVRGVRWTARLRPRTITVGAHVARRVGPNVEVTEYRPYRQGDDPRRLDWKLLARTDRAYVRLAPDVATSPTLIALDATASMGAPTKWRAAKHLCIGLTAVARGAGDPVGLVMAHDDVVPRVPPRARGDVVREMIRLLDSRTPRGTAPLAPLLDGTRGIDRMVLITDLLGDTDALLTRVMSLTTRGVEVIVVHLVAREELAPDMARVIAADPEDATIRRPLARRTLATYTDAFSAFRTQMRARTLATGARYIEVVDDLPPADAVRAVVRIASGAGLA
jgi:uncharacterized protein (DUF58 family)